MDAARGTLLQRLTDNLEELTKIYRQLLELVRHERDLLIGADLDGLNKNNETKDALIMKARMADALRIKIAGELSREMGLDPSQPRLLEIARKAGGPEGDRLRSLHAALETLLARTAELNRSNENYAMSALKTLTGALDNLKETIAGKKTYGGKGQYKIGPETTGNFVRKEV